MAGIPFVSFVFCLLVLLLLLLLLFCFLFFVLFFFCFFFLLLLFVLFYVVVVVFVCLFFLFVFFFVFLFFCCFFFVVVVVVFCTVYCNGNRLKINITPHGESSIIQLTELKFKIWRVTFSKRFLTTEKLWNRLPLFQK